MAAKNSSYKSGRNSSSLWHASASCRALCLSNSSSSIGGSTRTAVCVQDVQYQPPQARSRAPSATAEPSGELSYTTVWQAVHAAELHESHAAPAVRLVNTAAFLTFDSTAAQSASNPFSSHVSQRRVPSFQAGLRTPYCSSVMAYGTWQDASQATCLQATQLLQTAAVQGLFDTSTTIVGPATLASCCSSSGGHTLSASLLAMLRCAASEQRDARFVAGSVDSMDSCAGSLAPHMGIMPNWMLPYGCHGQQLSGGKLFAARLLPMPLQNKLLHKPHTAAASAAAAVRQNWAVCGGTGALGMLTAHWMQHRNAASLLLLGRSGRFSGDGSHRALLQAAPECCTVVRMCDAAVHSDTQAAAAGTPWLWAGWVHAGGILRDAMLLKQTSASIRAVHAPKTASLHQLLSAACILPIQQCLLFSSIAAVTGPTGSTNYAAANAGLDAATEQTQLQGKLLPMCWSGQLLACDLLLWGSPLALAACLPL